MSYFSDCKDDFLLNPDIVFLNHGSFGATPKPVFDSYQQWQRVLETQPVDFLGRRFNDLLYQSREELATFLKVDPLDIVYVPNTTYAINTVARSLNLSLDDIVLTTDHEYGAMDRTWSFLASKSGFSYLPVCLPDPIPDIEELVKVFKDKFSPNVKALFLSHITSSTAVVFPIKQICQAAHQAGILTIIDGAHAPGQIPLDIESLGVDFYAGNLHKWLCAPKGSAFLWASRPVQHLIKPLVVSWGYQSDHPGPSRFIDLLEWSGTTDISAYLAVPDAIRYQKTHHWDQVQTTCHQKADQLNKSIQKLTELPSLCCNESQFAQMFSARLPGFVDVDEMKKRLYGTYHIEVPLHRWRGNNLIRVSIQAYNCDEDLSRLLDALSQMI